MTWGRPDAGHCNWVNIPTNLMATLNVLSFYTNMTKQIFDTATARRPVVADCEFGRTGAAQAGVDTVMTAG